MTATIRKILSPKVRTLIYAQAAIVGSILVYFGWAKEETTFFLLGTLDQLLGSVLAFFHTPNTNPAVTEERPL